MSRNERDSLLEIRLFGGLDVRVEGDPLPPLRSRREQWLLALLALRHDRDTARDWLATTLWIDAEPSQALFYLRKALSNLRAALGPAASRLLSPTPRTVRLDLTGAFADFMALDTAANSPHTTKDNRVHAVGLYGGELLPECQEEWIFPERQRFAQTYLVLLESLADDALATGEPADAARWLRRVLTAEPYHEHACQRLMQALADCGDPAAVTQVYRELRRRLHDDLNAAPAPETEELYKRLQQQPPAPTALPVTPTEQAAPRHLPVPLTELVGRELEIDDVRGWLSRRRLVTLLGSGGIGKTRLAIAAADALLPNYPGGAWFLDFAAISDAAQVPAFTSATLGIPDAPHSLPEHVLTQRLAAQTMLLVFDNCEHLLDGIATLANTLLTACPDIRVLATSRQALGVPGEQVIPVAPLAVPPPHDAAFLPLDDAHEKDPHVLMEYAAVRLFVERAIESSPAFRLTRRNQATVVSVVQELDGIPLALEMAAARLRSLSLTDIQARLSTRLALLTTGNRGGRPRHQTIRAAIAWSHDLLTAAEQTLLRRLSVFVGSWTLPAAAFVCGEDNEPVTLDDMAEWHSLLAEKSLLLRESSGDETRFHLLATVREYAAEQLASHGETEPTRTRHLLWHRDEAQRFRDGLNAGNDPALMAAMDSAQGDVRAAVEFARAGDRAQEGLQLVGLLHSYWIGRGRIREGLTHCRMLLDAPGAQSRTLPRAEALRSGGWLAHYHNQYANADRFGEEWLSIAREQGDVRLTAQALSLLSASAVEQGHHERARVLITECVAIWRAEGSTRFLANTLNIQGEILQVMGDLAGAQASIAEALALRREQGNEYGVAASQYALGRVLFESGDWAAAEACCRESLRLFQQTDAPFWASSMQIQLGWIAVKTGRIAEGVALCREGLEAQRAIENAQFTAYGLDGLAEAACAMGQWERAARLHGAADTLRRDAQCFALPLERREHERQAVALAAALGEDAYRRFLSECDALTLPQMLALPVG